mmetsp:Transcript_92673/g.155551  ORF Transcript_92673/g.155551 Transcript_92673/m.155551 type:complete len:133 (-) Transcript_92673:683-1081(-)
MPCGQHFIVLCHTSTTDPLPLVRQCPCTAPPQAVGFKCGASKGFMLQTGAPHHCTCAHTFQSTGPERAANQVRTCDPLPPTPQPPHILPPLQIHIPPELRAGSLSKKTPSFESQSPRAEPVPPHEEGAKCAR